jgi:hypothetical protein
VIIVVAISAQAPGALPSVYGTVLHGNGMPAAEYQVFVSGPVSVGPSMTDSAGRFALWEVPPGQYICTVETLNGYIVWRAMVQIPTSMRITLQD